MIVALRAFGANETQVNVIGCSIDPTKEGLKRYNQYHASFGGQLPPNADIRQIAMDTKSHSGFKPSRSKAFPRQRTFAQVLVEADYRMKLIGIGLQDPMIPLQSWIDRTTPGANANALQRWYFQADYSFGLDQRSWNCIAFARTRSQAQRRN